MSSKQNFEEWRRKVDRSLLSIIGLSSDDLPDRPYHSMYESGITPCEAAQEALEYAGLELEDV